MEKETKGMNTTVNIEELNIYFGESNSNYYEKPRFLPEPEEETVADKSDFFRKLANTESLDGEDFGEAGSKINDDSGTVNADRLNPEEDETKDDSGPNLPDEEAEELLKEIFGSQGPRHKGCRCSNDTNSSDERWVIRITRENHQGQKGECHGCHGRES